jgi:hypothetical protein
MQVSPSSALADGESTITATVTIRDLWNNPVAGKAVTLYAGNSPVKITGPTLPTDANGQTTATIKATTPCTNSISVIAPVIVTPPATVQFTSPSRVPPDPALSNAIVRIYQDTYEKLTYNIPVGAQFEGESGDKFQVAATEAGASQAIDLIFGTFGITTTALNIKLIDGKVADEILVDVSQYIANATTSDILHWIAQRSNGLEVYANVVSNVAAGRAQELHATEQSLLSSVPTGHTYLTTAYTNDLQARLLANWVLLGVMQTDEQLLDDYANNAAAREQLDQVTGVVETGVGLGLVVATGGSAALAEIAVPIMIGYSAATTTINEVGDFYSLNNNQKAYAKSVDLLVRRFTLYAEEIPWNVTQGYSQISSGVAPNTVMGLIQAATTLPVSDLVPAYSTTTDTDSSLHWTYVVDRVSCNVTLSNASPQTAYFLVFGIYNYSGKAFGFDSLMPFVGYTLTNLNANQVADVMIPLFDGDSGGLPIGQISLYVLGANEGGFFYIGMTNPPPVSLSLPPFLSSLSPNSGAKKDSPTPKGLDNQVAIIENPIRCRISRMPDTQTYQEKMWIVNPFAQPLLATVTQVLPSGVTVLSTDGTPETFSIVWTNYLATNGFMEATITFSLGVIPGAQTNLPPPTVIFSDLVTNTPSIQSVTAGFKGLFPIRVSASVPVTVLGTDASMQVTVTNWTGTDQTGSLTIALADATGAPITNFTQSFFVSGSGSTVLAFTMPGMLPPGQYLLTGSLSVGGGTGQVLAGIYTVQLPPVMLGTASPQSLNMNGLNLSLQGAIGSNYLIEASTDLISWSPILYFSTTNSPFYFTDPSATNSSMQFYRAVMP